jgi:hypothetical protein
VEAPAVATLAVVEAPAAAALAVVAAPAAAALAAVAASAVAALEYQDLGVLRAVPAELREALALRAPADPPWQLRLLAAREASVRAGWPARQG